MEKIKAVLEELEYESVADYFQFVVDKDKPELKVKIDFLAPPVSDEQKKLVKISKPRIRPKKAKNIHGYLTEKAVSLEEKLITIDIGETDELIEVFLPHPFTYLVLKLFALRDRLDDEGKSFGAYHAFDIYRVIAMMTEEEWGQSIQLRDKYAESSKIREACHIVNQLFSSAESDGINRLKRHAKDKEVFIKDEKFSAIIGDLTNIFSKRLFG